MIRIEGFTKKFGDKTAVANFNLHVEKGDIFGFIGPNGAGKTTTIRFLATLLKPTAGEAWINNYSVTKQPMEVRRSMGYMPDSFGVYEGMRVWEYLDFFAAAYNIKKEKRKQIIRDVIELLDLNNKRDDFVEGLSRGIVPRLSHDAAASEVFDHVGRRMPSRNDERHEGECGPPVGQEDGRDMAVKMIDADDRNIFRVGQGLPCGDSDEQRSDEAGTARDGDSLNIVEADARLFERLQDDGHDGLDVLAGGDLRHDAAEAAVRPNLRSDDVGQQFPSVADDGGGRFIAG